ncbi:MAG TPA: ribonuclease HI family protein [Patescibacteria group bacterium]|nr:ribonuclease HI family protein [Patescibacteria group bacterium]
MSRFSLYTDGGARGNPGPAASGAVLYEDGKILARVGKFLGINTNNQAEYTAIVIGLEKALDLGIQELSCFMDSELAVKQLRLEYKVKNKGLAPLFLKVWNLSKKFKRISFQHVPRERNKEADKAVNEVLDYQRDI